MTDTRTCGKFGEMKLMRWIQACLSCLMVVMGASCLSLTGFEIGGGGSRHWQPERIIPGQPTVLELELTVWGDGSGKMSKRWKQVKCHYRLVGTKQWTTISMTPKIEEEERIVFTCTLPPQDQVGGAVEYYFDKMFDGYYNKDKDVRRVPISPQPISQTQPADG